MKYSEKIKELIKVTGIEEEEIFHFESSPLEIEFQKIFDFYSETLVRNSNFGIAPAYFFFRYNTSRNARATVKNGNFIIAINAGTIIFLHEKFKIGEENIGSLEKILDKKIIRTEHNTLLYQFALHFTFYHELAHLIQRSDNLIDESVSLLESDSYYSERKHLEEFDADAFSSICLSAHIIQLFNDNYYKNSSFEEFEKLIRVMCSTGINYILSFNGMEKDLYFYENSHPHPVIRISQILAHMLKYAQLHFGKDIFTDELAKKITLEAFELSSELFGNQLGDMFREKFKSNYKDIKDYVKYFRDLAQNDVSLALYKWNLAINKL